MKQWWWTGLFLAFFALVPSVRAGGDELRVLLVGNSYTRFNIMPRMLERLAASVEGGPALRADRVTHAGYTLRMHWRRREVRRRLSERRYTHVVLQGHSLSPIQRPDEMHRYANRFGRLIGERGARPVLYETWARAAEHSFYRRHPLDGGPPEMQRRVGQTYASLSRNLSAPVAPVGSAFRLVQAEMPELELLRRDGSHPTVQGSYLVALVLYSALTGVDPGRASYRPFHVSPFDAARMREVATRVTAGGQRPDTALATVAPVAPSPPAPPVDGPGGLY